MDTAVGFACLVSVAVLGGVTGLSFTTSGGHGGKQAICEGVLNPNDTQYEWTAQQLVMKVSDGNLCRGFFICKDERKMMKRRWKAMDISETIEFSGTSITDNFFSKDFEEESTSQHFMQTIDNFGTKVAVDGNVNYLFVTAKAGGSVSHDKKHSKTIQTKTDKEYFSSIKGYTIPMKSIDLDPIYMLLNERVLVYLIKIEKIGTTGDNQKTLFIEFFKKYGTHFLTGTMEFGGTLIVKAETSIQGTSTDEKIKDTVTKASDAYLDISASFIEGSGGVDVRTSAYHLKSHITSSLNDETLKSITLDIQKKGGPPGEDNIGKWKKGLVEQTDTWRIIDKNTELIAVWDLILLNHYDLFQDAANFASLMKEAWEYIIELPSFYIEAVDSQAMAELAKEFRELGISSSGAAKRKQLVIDMISQGKVGVQKNSRYAHLDVTEGGQVIMSTLQEEPLDPTTTMLQFESIKFLAEKPYKVYLRLEYNSIYLGEIIIVLDGSSYPSRVKQMLEISTGDNNVNGTWRNAKFSISYLGDPGEWMFSDKYKNAEGFHSNSLFPVEDKRDNNTPVVVGEVRGMPGQVVGFNIRTKEYPDRTENWPVMGHLTSGLDILEAMSAHALATVTISDCGLVVI